MAALLLFGGPLRNKKPIHYEEIASPSDALLQEMQALRLTMIALKPGITPQDDFDGFKDYFLAPGRYAHVFRFQDGRLAGFYCMGCEHYSEGMVLSVEYLFFHPKARRHVPYRKAMVMFGLRKTLANPRKPKAFAGLGYPASYLVFKRYFGARVHTLQSQRLDPPQRHLLERFAATMGADPRTGVAQFRTLPPTTHASNDDYDRQNPTWREGNGLLFSIPVSFSTMFSNLGWALAGAMRRKKQRR